MEVSITQFRRKMLVLVDRAMAGEEIWVTCKGRRFRMMPEGPPINRLSRIKPMDIINSEAQETVDESLQTEMIRAWERDWSAL
jgi:antitoxin (DNA-binding transcriptional repressor) of toxin-antitoxin stability system